MPPDRQRQPSARRQRVTLFRTRLIPFVLATALFALGGCGLFFEEGPTEATLATMNGLQAITEAIATAVLPEDLGGTTLPYSADATGSGNPDEGEFAAFGRALVQALGGTSQPLLSLDFLGDTATPCAPGGTVTLTGSADVTDARDPGTGRGDITIAFNGMQAVANLCEGYGHRSTGILTASANDLISISDAGVPDHDHWHVSRSELATGSLTVTKVSSGATYNVTVYWSRQGTLDLDVERPTSALTLLGQSQTVYLTVNGQSCTGHYTGRLISPYDWDCS
jgi:hypothetical protein